MPPLLMALLAVCGILLVVIGLLVPHTGRDLVETRLAAFAERPHSLADLESRLPFSERVLHPLFRHLAALVRRIQRRDRSSRSTRTSESDPSGLTRTQLKLVLAGNPYGWTADIYLGIKVFGALSLGGALFLVMTLGSGLTLAIGFGLFGAALGWFGPELLIRSRTQQRQKAIRRALPDALDLLVISVEAGLGFDAALQRMVDKKDDALTREFARMLAELRVGRSRREALQDLVARTQVPDLSHFVGAVLQAEALGVSITRVLNVQSEQMRTLRRQRAEQSAASLQLKLIFPLAIFIFPALCIVILGPIWPTVVANKAPGV